MTVEVVRKTRTVAIDKNSLVGEFFDEVAYVCTASLNHATIDRLVTSLVELREQQGRLFVLGVGGSAANASHAVNDFRKLCFIEAYAPTDNVAELTARTNDDGWDTVFEEWLKVSHLTSNDALLILSVGGGDRTRQVSTNLIYAIDYAREKKAKVFGIVGKPDGYTAKYGDVVVLIPTPKSSKWITPLSEAMQAVIWHSLVSHPSLQVNKTKW
jgi:D-sedoheptulose 7-phosphate isomerase